MAHTLIRVYDNFLAAENARNALLGSGFAPSCVQLDSRGDEAGPVDGNFILDYKDTPQGPRAAFYSYLFGKERGRAGEADAEQHTDICDRGNHVLTVDTEDDVQFALANDITMRFGAIDVAERTGKRHEG